MSRMLFKREYQNFYNITTVFSCYTYVRKLHRVQHTLCHTFLFDTHDGGGGEARTILF